MYGVAVKACKVDSLLADGHNTGGFWHTLVFRMRDRQAISHSSTPQRLALQDRFDNAVELPTDQLSHVAQALDHFTNNTLLIL